MRYSELRKELANITDAVLAAALKELIADDMVARKAYNEIPPHVEYELTEKGNFGYTYITKYLPLVGDILQGN